MGENDGWGEAICDLVSRNGDPVMCWNHGIEMGSWEYQCDRIGARVDQKIPPCLYLSLSQKYVFLIGLSSWHMSFGNKAVDNEIHSWESCREMTFLTSVLEQLNWATSLVLAVPGGGQRPHSLSSTGPWPLPNPVFLYSSLHQEF